MRCWAIIINLLNIYTVLFNMKIWPAMRSPWTKRTGMLHCPTCATTWLIGIVPLNTLRRQKNSSEVVI